MFVHCFESFKSSKSRKRKRKHVVQHAQLKRRVERSATPYSLRCLKTGKPTNHLKPAPVSEPSNPVIPNTPAFPRTVLFADEVENNDDGSYLGKANHANDNWLVVAPQEFNENNEYDPKLSELKVTALNGNDADNLAIQFQEAMVSPEKDSQMNDQPNVAGTEPVEIGPGKPVGKRRKSILTKRFRTHSGHIPNVDASAPAQTEVTDDADRATYNAALVYNAIPDPVKPAREIVKIIRPIGFSPAVANALEQRDVLVSFIAMRSVTQLNSNFLFCYTFDQNFTPALVFIINACLDKY